MLVVLATITAQPDHADAVRDVLTTLAETSRQDDGCEGYTLTQSADDPAMFVTVERWRDAAALEAHMNTPHIAQAFESAGGMLAAEPEIKQYTPVG